MTLRLSTLCSATTDSSLLQERAIERARSAGCYQMRSRSPVTSTENHQLKIAAGYVLSPSEQNDSYYFLLKL